MMCFKINGCAFDKMSQDFGRSTLEREAHDYPSFSNHGMSNMSILEDDEIKKRKEGQDAKKSLQPKKQPL